jgi:hypothetical protein
MMTTEPQPATVDPADGPHKRSMIGVVHLDVDLEATSGPSALLREGGPAS